MKKNNQKYFPNNQEPIEPKEILWGAVEDDEGDMISYQDFHDKYRL